MNTENLPEDFRRHWFQNFIYETYFYVNLTKIGKLDGYYINLYKYTSYRGKHIKIYYVRYNTMIQNYEIEYPSVGRIRYPDYDQTLHAMWNLERPAQSTIIKAVVPMTILDTPAQCIVPEESMSMVDTSLEDFFTSLYARIRGSEIQNSFVDYDYPNEL